MGRPVLDAGAPIVGVVASTISVPMVVVARASMASVSPMFALSIIEVEPSGTIVTQEVEDRTGTEKAVEAGADRMLTGAVLVVDSVAGVATRQHEGSEKYEGRDDTRLDHGILLPARCVGRPRFAVVERRLETTLPLAEPRAERHHPLSASGRCWGP